MSEKSNLALMHVIVVLFGVGAWVAINGVWVELPILVEQLPAGWNLPSYLIIILQAANIGPLIVTVMEGFFSKYYHQNVLIHIILALGTSACFFLIFFWDDTVNIGGIERSIPFFILYFVIGFVDCNSSVTFMPFMTNFQVVFMTTYFIGEGLSGFLPSIFALIQGVSVTYCENVTFVNASTNETEFHVITKSYEPRFSVEVFFVLLTLMMAGCFSSYIMLNHLNLAKSFLQNPVAESSQDVFKSTSTELSRMDAVSDDVSYSRGYSINANEENDSKLHEGIPALTTKNYVYLYSIVFLISLTSNGLMPSVNSYSSLPYGQLPYHFAVTLGAMSNPVACFMAIFLPIKSFVMVGVFFLMSTAFASFLMFLAVESPCPILVDTDGGSALMVLSQIAFVFTTSYTKVSIGQILRERGQKKSLVWYGAFTQLGSLTGACIAFPLVNVYDFFTSGDQCNTVCD